MTGIASALKIISTAAEWDHLAVDIFSKCSHLFATIMGMCGRGFVLDHFPPNHVLKMLAVGCFVFLTSPSGNARSNLPPTEGVANETPKQLQDVGIEEHLGDTVDLGLKFRNEAGELVELGSFFSSGRPVLLSLAYYSCPNLCNLHLNGVKDVLSKINWTTGKEFEYIVVSIDPKEGPEAATAKKANYLKAYGRVGAENGWHFLTGDEDSIRKLAHQVGFKYQWDEKEQQWAHAAVAHVLTPAGKISRYLYGVFFEPQTVRLSLIEASSGTIGNLVERLILFCFHWDPKASKYTLYAFNVMRAGSIMVVLVMAAFLFPFWRRQRKMAQSL